MIDPTSHWQTDIFKDSTLRFRCFVNPALVPLYARAGPNLELHTTNVSTAQWLKNRLLGNIWLEEDDLDRFQPIQGPLGLLVGVEGTSRKASGSSTSELLVYGVLSTTTSFGPISSSLDYPEHNQEPVIRQELRIYASPLSGSIISKAQKIAPPPQKSGLAGDDEQIAQFLPGLRSPSPKRKRMASLFDSVTDHKRMRQSSYSQPTQPLQSFKIKRESEEPSLPVLDRIASQRARSLSIGANLKSAESRPGSARGYVRGPISRKNTPAPFIESSLKREQSPGLFSSDTKQESFSETPKDAETILSENKNTITRTIMTCMRLYGYNRPKTGNPSKNTEDKSQGDEKDPRTGTADSTEEDEFKAMYHATYRASTFALRKYLKEPVANGEGIKAPPPLLEKKKAMGYIDEFLRLFCEEN